MTFLKDFKSFAKSLQLNESTDPWESFNKFVESGAASVAKGGPKKAPIYFVHDPDTPGDFEISSSDLAKFQETEQSSDSSAALTDIASKADVIGAAFNKSWEIRKSQGLDDGPLRKQGGWYVGKGAWRINSNKAVATGTAPDWIKWYDPMHDEIIKNFFPDGFDNDESDIDDTSIDDEESNANLQNLLQTTGIEMSNKEYAMAESKKLKYISRINEARTAKEDDWSMVEKGVRPYTPRDLKESLKMSFMNPARQMPMIWGAPGIGKTQVILQVAQEIAREIGKSVPVMIVALSQKAPEDLGGIPLMVGQDNIGSSYNVLPREMKGKVQQVHAIPGWLPAQNEKGDGILFFDEINTAHKQTLAACLSLLLDRKTASGDYIVPNGWRVMAAGNRASEADVTPLSFPVSARFTAGNKHLVPSLNDWLMWARSEHGYFKGPGVDIDKLPGESDAAYADRNNFESGTIEQFIIPSEFISFLKLIESDRGDGKDELKGIPRADAGTKVWTDFDGNIIKTKFKHFFRFDKQQDMKARGHGVDRGIPTPRSWTNAFIELWPLLQQNKQLVDQSTITDPRFETISVLPYLTKNRRTKAMLSATLGDIVGEESAGAFVRYLENLAKFSDEDGTLREKLDRIFDNPSGPRPLLKGKIEYSEIQEILALVECEILDRGESLTLDQYVNWTKYCVDVADYAKDAGAVAPHVKMTNSLNDTMFKYSMVMVSTVRIVQAKTPMPQTEVAYITNKVNKYIQGTKWDVKSLGSAFSQFTNKFADMIKEFKNL